MERRCIFAIMQTLLNGNDRCNLLVICGPTASGKTALAVAIARWYNGEIISADSRQVYRGLDIGSGKDLHEYGSGPTAVPVHCSDCADPETLYTLYHYQRDCYRALEGVYSRDRLPLLCGGSGLYIEAVLKGYDIPQVPEDAALRADLMRHSREKLALLLAAQDADRYGQTDISSKKRIVRAIEVTAAAPPRDKMSQNAISAPVLRPLVLCTRFPRPELHERIDRRLDERLSAGMVDEVAALRATGVPDERLLMLGMEYRYCTRYLRREIDYGTMVATLRREIRQLAKRQETWFRGMERRGTTVHWIDKADLEAALGVVGEYLPLYRSTRDSRFSVPLIG
jgi:tRNA dimethylallyltransferase